LAAQEEHRLEFNGAQSVDRALGLLALVGRYAGRGAGLSDLVEDSGLNKPTARRLLLALIRAGYVEQDEATRRYFLGAESYVLGSLAAPRYGLLQFAMDSVVRLSRQTQDSAFVSVRRDLVSVCLHREEGTYPVRTHALQTGFEHPLGCGAGSLAILAALPDAEIETVLEANAQVLHERYPLLPQSRIRSDVEQARAQGYALNPGLIVANSWGVGVVIRDTFGRPAGALSIAAIDTRLQQPRQAEIGALLMAEALRVEQKLAQRQSVYFTPVPESGRRSA
jgi:DNA-binding IclR family transcriptional regulator